MSLPSLDDGKGRGGDCHKRLNWKKIRKAITRFPYKKIKSEVLAEESPKSEMISLGGRKFFLFLAKMYIPVERSELFSYGRVPLLLTFQHEVAHRYA